jgi:hypothetical protein
MSRERSREVQGTDKQASMLASRHHIKIFSKKFKSMYIVRARVACQVLKSASNGQIACGAGCANGAQSFLQVLCTITQGCTT